ncbi:MAG: UDP-N-acetylmuramoyl-tripeptide--D-alanyl-D-alanine ligase [Clostridia bacterium]|nr:UDP-N-acetylmuramoyl-tripeptide--D-alanyl-D-alanine ligase [Clostridia bacterium]
MIKGKIYSAKGIAEIVNGELIGDDCSIEQISLNSKEKSVLGHCFFAIKGEKFDGENFVLEAVKNGAKIVVSSKREPTIYTKIYVRDTKEALYKLAKYNIGNTKIIGVTGSVGKTTIKELASAVLSKKYSVSATYENYNNEIGVSLTLLGIKDEDFCVVEMGMRGLGEIELLARISTPEISIISNAGTAHIERLGSEENILKAKAEILKHTKKHAIVPSEKRFKGIDYKNLKVSFIGEQKGVYSDWFNIENEGISFNIIDNNLNKEYNAFIHSFYPHDIQNALFAYELGRVCNVPAEKIIDGIFEFKNYKNRGSIQKIRNFELINDSYNASLESVKASIIGLLGLCKKKNKIPFVVLGDMLENGDFSEKYHLEIGAFLRKNNVENLVTFGCLSQKICEGLGGGIHFDSYEKIIDYLKENVNENHIALIKASRRLSFEKIIEGLKQKNEN